MDRRSIQRSGYPSTRPARVNSEDLLEDYDDIWPSRMPSSTRRYRSDVKQESGRVRADVQSAIRSEYPVTRPGRSSSVPARSTATQTRTPVAQENQNIDSDEIITRRSGDLARKTSYQYHWLFYVGLAMVIVTVGWLLVSVIGNWWQVTQDDWHYGRPRTAQYDVVVGHNDSATNPSHFIAINLNRHVEVIEFPGGDASKAKIYVGPVLIGQDQDLAPVTLNFKDVNSDGKPDMIVSIQDSRFVFINDNDAFRPLHPGEVVHLSD